MVKLTFLGHACWLIESPQGKVIIDPFLNGNPQAVKKPEDIVVDAILVTHGHGDHLGDAIAISKKNNAVIVAPYELATFCGSKGANVHPMHIGGSREFPFGWVKLVPASHGSGYVDEKGQILYLGNPCGFILKTAGKVIYHAGDTGVIADMELIGKMYKVDVALLPIGGNFTMDPEDALCAVKMIKPKVVIPMHYSTWPLIEQDPNAFVERVNRETETKGVVVKPGETYEV